MSELDLLCFSHLRWDFVFQRPNHLMTQCSRSRRAFYVEEPCVDTQEATLSLLPVSESIVRVIPHLHAELHTLEGSITLRALLSDFMQRERIERPVHWFYSPMFLPAAQTLPCALTVYDCMDELTGFKGAPAAMAQRERELLVRADVMFTGGRALYEAKRHKHDNVHCFPSSVDVPFFSSARDLEVDPVDQAKVGGPRLGYYGAIDERIDLALLAHLADARPDWQIIMLGPVVKLDPRDLPRRDNIHFLGQRPYAELPHYASGWDVALMPFALNDATRYISPTKTPEYLGAGLPVVSTAIHDVVEPYESLGFVRIGRTFDEFVAHVGRALAGEYHGSCAERDAFLAAMSWEETWRRMETHVARALGKRLRAGTDTLSLTAAQ